jgi:hypothetical protein
MLGQKMQRRWAGYVTRMLDYKCIKMLIGNPERKRQFGMPRCRWEVDIEMDLKGMCVAWTKLAKDRIH